MILTFNSQSIVAMSQTQSQPADLCPASGALHPLSYWAKISDLSKSSLVILNPLNCLQIPSVFSYTISSPVLFLLISL